jgi:predicted RNase H-like nuclease (RuvC/YqgF family)
MTRTLTEDELCDDPIALHREVTRLEKLIDNCDDVLKKTNKEKREFRSLLGESREKVVELESLLDSARAEIDVLKVAPMVSDEIECTNCDATIAELVELKKKYMTRIEELDVLNVELSELRSRTTLLGVCTSVLICMLNC